MKKTFYYPDNLAATSVFLKYWSIKDVAIVFGILLLAILCFILLHVWVIFLLAVGYGFISMRVAKGYSVLKLIILYVRYIFTDKLIIKW